MKIMKKNILFGVVCVALLTATSCSDFLDVQPEGDARDNAYFLNDQQAIDAVDGLYERFHQEAMYGREQGAANDIVWGKTRDFPTLATFKYTGDESPLRTVFETMYKVISRSNWVIDQLVDKEKTTALTEIENRSLGEAYFTVHPTFRVMRQSCRAYSLRVKYRSSLNPYALRFITFILLLIPSTFPVET